MRRHCSKLARSCLFVLNFIDFCIAFAETITLKNGSVVKGSIVEMSETEITVDTSDMGRIKVKRRTVDTISDGIPADKNQTSTSNGPVNININNTQTNDQKLENKNEMNQTQTVAVNEKSDRESKRSWGQGLYGRLLAGGGQTILSSTSKDHGIERAYKGYKGQGAAYWDVLGFRSASWWAASLEFVGGTSEKRGDLDMSWTLVGPNLEVHLYRETHGKDAISQFYIGAVGGSLSFDVKSKSDVDLAMFSGSGFGVKVGYDYLISSHLGISVNVGHYRGTIKTSTLTPAGEAANVPMLLGNDKKPVNLRSTNAVVGLLYNFDL